MSAVVELSGKPCHFCGKSDTTYKTKIKSQDFQAVLCAEHLKQMLQSGQDDDGKLRASAKKDATVDGGTSAK